MNCHDALPSPVLSVLLILALYYVAGITDKLKFVTYRGLHLLSLSSAVVSFSSQYQGYLCVEYQRYFYVIQSGISRDI